MADNQHGRTPAAASEGWHSLDATRLLDPQPEAAPDAAATRLIEATPAPAMPPKPQTGPALPAGTELLHRQYRIRDFLGAGGFGLTYLALDSLDREVVVKECFPVSLCTRQGTQVAVRRSEDKPQFARIVAHFDAEARRLAHLSHPNIVGVHQVFADNGTAYFALDLIRGRTLADTLLQGLPPPTVKRLLLTLLDALGYLHARGILHRDIAPDNILLKSNDDPVLIDFGAARGEGASDAVRAGLETVKDGYSPPEFYRQGREQSPASDLYALAASFYHVITGAPPPGAEARLAATEDGDPDPYVPLSDFDRRFDRWFVGAINRSLSLAPEDRLADAEAWTQQIHEARRREAALAKARQDRKIEASISRLVADAQRPEPEPLPEPPVLPVPAAPDPPPLPSPPIAVYAPKPPPAAAPPPVRPRGRLARVFGWLTRF